jgi:hypothetical protein
MTLAASLKKPRTTKRRLFIRVEEVMGLDYCSQGDTLTVLLAAVSICTRSTTPSRPVALVAFVGGASVTFCLFCSGFSFSVGSLDDPKRWADEHFHLSMRFKLSSFRSERDLTFYSRLPTVQQACIPQGLLHSDLLCQAKSGLGKTAVFVLTTLHSLDPVEGEVQVLVMCHTRELAYQIKNEYARFSKYLPQVKTGVFYGGTPMQKDIDVLSNKETRPNIVVGTPGRLNALVRDKKLSLRNVKAFVLDECDKMLDQIGRV